jgi:hypothetical protein
MKSFTQNQVATMCEKYGSQVGPLPAGVNGAQLLWAMTGNESSFGENCTPRHEAAFDVGGIYGSHAPMPALIALYGSPVAACSYGPLQVMLCNASGCSPEEMDDLDTAFHASVSYLNSELRRFQPQSLDEIGECWNAGHITPDPDYTSKLEANYAVPIPTNGE